MNMVEGFRPNNSTIFCMVPWFSLTYNIKYCKTFIFSPSSPLPYYSPPKSIISSSKEILKMLPFILWRIFKRLCFLFCPETLQYGNMMNINGNKDIKTDCQIETAIYPWHASIVRLGVLLHHVEYHSIAITKGKTKQLYVGIIIC